MLYIKDNCDKIRHSILPYIKPEKISREQSYEANRSRTHTYVFWAYLQIVTNDMLKNGVWHNVYLERPHNQR